MNSYIENNTYVVELKAGEVKTERQFMDVLWEAFSLPYAFEKHNLDALDDWMRDLSWLQYTSFRIKVTGYNSFMQKGTEIGFVKKSLEFYKEYWDTQLGYRFDIEFE